MLAQGDVSDKGFLPNGLRGQTVVTQFTYFDRLFVKGPRKRYGAEFDWVFGPFGSRAEYMFATDARDQQGLGDEDLSNIPSFQRRMQWFLENRPELGRQIAYLEGMEGHERRLLAIPTRFDKLAGDSKKGQDPRSEIHVLRQFFPIPTVSLRAASHAGLILGENTGQRHSSSPFRIQNERRRLLTPTRRSPNGGAR